MIGATISEIMRKFAYGLNKTARFSYRNGKNRHYYLSRSAARCI